MSQQDKIFVGNGKKNDQYGFINFSICLSDLPQEHITEFKGKKYINLTISEKRESPDQYGKTHSVVVNTWKPEGSAEQANEEVTDDLPF
jgi:hypothetical protein